MTDNIKHTMTPEEEQRWSSNPASFMERTHGPLRRYEPEEEGVPPAVPAKAPALTRPGRRNRALPRGVTPFVPVSESIPEKMSEPVLPLTAPVRVPAAVSVRACIISGCDDPRVEGEQVCAHHFEVWRSLRGG